MKKLKLKNCRNWAIFHIVKRCLYAKLIIHTTDNTISATNALNITATDDVTITENVGAYGLSGVASLGASVGVNAIENTVLAYVGSSSDLTMNNANLSINAKSSETVTATANVVGGSTIALSGGVLHNTVGKNSTNAAPNDLSGDDAASYNQAKTQAQELVSTSQDYMNEANITYKENYNQAINSSKQATSDAQENIKNHFYDF